MRGPPLFLSILLLASCDRPSPVEEPEPGNQALAPPAASTAPSPRLAAIPTDFTGTFERDRASCARATEYRLTVTPRELRFHESVARVRNVIVDGPEQIRVTLDFQGEGESWREERQLRLGEAGERLIVTGEGSEAARIRCPDGGEPGPASTWRSAASGEGDALFLESGDGRLITLFCPSGSTDLVVNVPAFRPIGSEERMSFGSGGTVFVLVADSRGDPERGGVSGRARVPAELATILGGSAGLAVNYGAQNSGPHPAPPAELAADFLRGCDD